MESQPANSLQIEKDKKSLIAVNVADAILLLYMTVKARKEKEFIEKIKNGRSKYGKSKRISI